MSVAVTFANSPNPQRSCFAPLFAMLSTFRLPNFSFQSFSFSNYYFLLFPVQTSSRSIRRRLCVGPAIYCEPCTDMSGHGCAESRLKRGLRSDCPSTHPNDHQFKKSNFTEPTTGRAGGQRSAEPPNHQHAGPEASAPSNRRTNYRPCLRPALHVGGYTVQTALLVP